MNSTKSSPVNRANRLTNTITRLTQIHNLAQKHTPTTLPKDSPLKFKHQDLFDKYLLQYAAQPSYKKILSTMIKYEEMYQPITKGSLYVDPFGHISQINAERKLKRAQIYLNKRDLLNVYDKKKGKRLVISSRGHKIFYQDYPLAKLRQKKWDGVWTVIMYDFPEKERVKRRILRRKLMGFGFGAPQISILISPLPIEEPVQKLLEGENVTDKVWTLRASRILGLSNQEVAQKAWPILTELDQLYQELLQTMAKIIKLKKDRSQQKLLKLWKSYFLAVDAADPYLPRELLPHNWPGKRCEQEFRKLGGRGVLSAIFALFG